MLDQREKINEINYLLVQKLLSKEAQGLNRVQWFCSSRGKGVDLWESWGPSRGRINDSGESQGGLPGVGGLMWEWLFMFILLLHTVSCNNRILLLLCNGPLYDFLSIQRRCQDHSKRKEYSFWQMVLGKQDIHMQKNEVGPFTHAIYKSNLKCI